MQSTSSAAITFFFLTMAMLPQTTLGEIIRDEYWPANSDGVWQMSSDFVGQVMESHVNGQLARIELSMDAYGPPSNIDTLFWQIISATQFGPDNGNTVLAAGAIQKANLPHFFGPINIDFTSFHLDFKAQEYFALTLYSPSPWRSWNSYRGYDAPNLTFKKFNGVWNKVDITNYSPPYAPAYSTFFAVVPEPASWILAGLGIVGFAVLGCPNISNGNLRFGPLFHLHT